MIKKFEKFNFRDSTLSPEIKVADVAAQPFEAKILYYKQGTTIPPHRHSSETLHLVLEGEIQVESGREEGGRTTIAAVGDYICGGWEYRGVALLDTYVLLIQPPGTEFIKR